MKRLHSAILLLLPSLKPRIVPYCLLVAYAGLM